MEESKSFSSPFPTLIPLSDTGHTPSLFLPHFSPSLFSHSFFQCYPFFRIDFSLAVSSLWTFQPILLSSSHTRMKLKHKEEKVSKRQKDSVTSICIHKNCGVMMHVNDGREVEFSKERKRERAKSSENEFLQLPKNKNFCFKGSKKNSRKKDRKKEKEDALLSWRNYNSSRHPSFFSHASFFHSAKIRKLRTKIARMYQRRTQITDQSLNLSSQSGLSLVSREREKERKEEKKEKMCVFNDREGGWSPNDWFCLRYQNNKSVSQNSSCPGFNVKILLEAIE